MSDDRPQYGEYASPEEQRQRAGLPPLDPATADLPPAGFETPPAPAAAAPARPSSADRIVTIGLLAYGLVNVIMSAIAYLDLPTVLEQSMAVLGIEGSFTNLGPARTWGGIAAFLLVAGYAATVWFAFRRLRASKRAWWVPLVGAAVTMVVVSLCLMVPMMGDPAFQAYLATAGTA